ncbi:hypothetical protein LX36DRAFT_109835 [Colletotrichum falcatum]|nr:hypothetical protein LX36DRAFT_109835 [Colletotrichum falcatum]
MARSAAGNECRCEQSSDEWRPESCHDPRTEGGGHLKNASCEDVTRMLSCSSGPIPHGASAHSGPRSRYPQAYRRADPQTRMTTARCPIRKRKSSLVCGPSNTLSERRARARAGLDCGEQRRMGLADARSQTSSANTCQEDCTVGSEVSRVVTSAVLLMCQCGWLGAAGSRGRMLTSVRMAGSR